MPRGKLKGRQLEAFRQKVVIRDFEERDAESCNDLFNVVFRRNRTIDQWRWRYKDRARGGSYIYVSELDGKIVGQYPVVATLYKIGDQEVLVHEHIDASMLPEFRGTGVYSKMGNMGHAHYEHAVNIGLGFPTPFYYRFGSKTLGYVGVEKVPRWLKVLNHEMVLRRAIPGDVLGRALAGASRPLVRLAFRARRGSQKQSFRFERLDAFDQRTDALWERVKNDRVNLAVRDHLHLNWRFTRNPFFRYDAYALRQNDEILAYGVAKTTILKKGRRGEIVDMLAVRDPAVERAMLAHLMSSFAGTAVDYVICLMMDRTYTTHLRELGFVRTPSRALLAFKNFKPERISTDILSKPENWYISGLDVDWL